MDLGHVGPSSIISKLQAIEDKISGNRFKGLAATKKKRETKVKKIHKDYVLLTSSDDENDNTYSRNDTAVNLRKRKSVSSNYGDDSDYEPAPGTYQANKDGCRPKRGRGRPKKLKTDAKIDIEKEHSLLHLTKVLSRAELRQQNNTRETNCGESCDSDKARIKRGRGRPRKDEIATIKSEGFSSSLSCTGSQDAVESGIFELSTELEPEHLLREAELSSNALQALAFVYQDENKSYSDAAELGLSFGDSPFNSSLILTPPPSAHTTPNKHGSLSHSPFKYASSNCTKNLSNAFTYTTSNFTKDSSNFSKSHSKYLPNSFKSVSKKLPINTFKSSTPSFTKDPKDEKPHVNSVHSMRTRRSSMKPKIEPNIRTPKEKDCSLLKHNLKSMSKPLKIGSAISIEKSKRKLYPIRAVSDKEKLVTSYAHLIGSRQHTESLMETNLISDEMKTSNIDENQHHNLQIKEETEPLVNREVDAAQEQSLVENIPIKEEVPELKTKRLNEAKSIEVNSFLLTEMKEEDIKNANGANPSDAEQVCSDQIQESKVETIQLNSSSINDFSELPNSNCIIKTESTNEHITSNINTPSPSNEQGPDHKSFPDSTAYPSYEGASSNNSSSLSNTSLLSKATFPADSKKALQNKSSETTLSSRNSKKPLRTLKSPVRARGGYRASSHPTLPSSVPTRRQFQVTPDSWLTCEKCGTIFKFLSTYNYHVATECNTKLGTVKADETEEENSGVFQCPQCPKQVASRTSLMVHLRQHTGERPFQCDLCPVAFYQKHHLRDHQDKIHVNPKSFSCRYCGETSLGYGAWKIHIGVCKTRRLKVNTLPCRLCGERFKTKEELDVHSASHLGKEKPFPCPSCPRRFHSSPQLSRHVRACCSPLPSPHVCPLCGKAFTSPRHLRSHQARHEGARALAYPCGQCPARFYSGYELRMHTRRHTDERPYPCPECLRKFRRKSTMELHLTLHTGVKPYVCTECGERFNRNVKLQIHRAQVHNKGKIFQCDHCSKSFPCKSYLIPHLRVHTGEKPYVCPICAQSFLRSYQLGNHLRRNHQRSEQNPYARVFVSMGEIGEQYKIEHDEIERNGIQQETDEDTASVCDSNEQHKMDHDEIERNGIQQETDEDTGSVRDLNSVQETSEENDSGQETNKVNVFNRLQEIDEENDGVQEIDEENDGAQEIDEDISSVRDFNSEQETNEENDSEQETTKVNVFNRLQEINEENDGVQEIDEDASSVCDFNSEQKTNNEENDSEQETTTVNVFNKVQKINEDNNSVHKTNKVNVFNGAQEVNYVETNGGHDIYENTRSVDVFNKVQETNEDNDSVHETNKANVFNGTQEINHIQSNVVQFIDEVIKSVDDFNEVHDTNEENNSERDTNELNVFNKRN